MALNLRLIKSLYTENTLSDISLSENIAISQMFTFVFLYMKQSIVGYLAQPIGERPTGL